MITINGNNLLQSIYDGVEIINDHFHSVGKVYPAIGAGVTLTAGAGAWGLGSFIEVIPANVINSIFDIHFINFENASNTNVYEMILYQGALGAEVEIGRSRTVRDTVQSGIASVPIVTPRVPANARVSAKLACEAGGGRTAVVTLFYHTY